MRKLRILKVVVIMTATLSQMSRAQAGRELPAGHWAYGALNDLASKGLIKGIPPDGRFLGSRTASRYELATIIIRVLQKLDDEETGRFQSHRSAPQVTPQQLNDIKRLTDEFKAELLVIGGNLTKALEEIEAVRTRLAETQIRTGKAMEAASNSRKTASDSKTGLQKVISGLNANSEQLNRIAGTQTSHRISGLIQGRFDAIDVGRTSLFTSTGAGGNGQMPANGGPAVGGPFFGFQVRRARIVVTGPASTRTDYKVQIDAQSTGPVNVQDAYVNMTHFPAKRMSVRIGLFPPVFGYELWASGLTRDAPERPFGWETSASDFPMFKTIQSPTGGVITPGSVLGVFNGQGRDVGAQLSWDLPGMGAVAPRITLSVINGEGRSASGVRNSNNGADLLGRIEGPIGSSGLSAGASFYYGTMALRSGAPSGDPPTLTGFSNGDRILGGIDLQWDSPSKTRFRAEWLGGIMESTPDRALYLPGNHTYAWYFSAKHPLSRKMDIATRYDEYYPISQSGFAVAGLGRMDYVRKTLGGGLLYSLDEALRLRLWYAKGLTPYDPSATSGPLRSRLGLITGEVQVSF